MPPTLGFIGRDQAVPIEHRVDGALAGTQVGPA
jgi:hypothetical protein